MGNGKFTSYTTRGRAFEPNRSQSLRGPGRELMGRGRRLNRFKDTDSPCCPCARIYRAIWFVQLSRMLRGISGSAQASGASRVSGTVYHSLRRQDGFASELIWPVFRDRDGNLWPARRKESCAGATCKIPPPGRDDDFCRPRSAPFSSRVTARLVSTTDRLFRFDKNRRIVFRARTKGKSAAGD